jgi:hypothetical protein
MNMKMPEEIDLQEFLTAWNDYLWRIMQTTVALNHQTNKESIDKYISLQEKALEKFKKDIQLGD